MFILLAAQGGYLQYQVSAINSALDSKVAIGVSSASFFKTEKKAEESSYIPADYSEEAGRREWMSEDLERESGQAKTREHQTRSSTFFLDVDSLPLTPYSDGPVQIGEFISPDDLSAYFVHSEEPRSIGAFVDPDAPQ
jgi:hypothetical protein